jgi:hypothetical protein
MASKTYFHFTHKGDIYRKTTSTNAAGQKYAAYTKVDTISFQFQAPSTSTSSGDERRLTPYQDNVPKFEAIVPKKSDANIAYGNRFENIKDRDNVVVDSSIYEIVGIQPKFGFNGKKHHTVVTLRRVVESE